MEVIDYTGIAFSQLRFYPSWLKEEVRKRGMWEDLRQTVRGAAFEAEKMQLSIKETSRLVQRRLYQYFIRDFFKRTHSGTFKIEVNYNPLIPISHWGDMVEGDYFILVYRKGGDKYGFREEGDKEMGGG